MDLGRFELDPRKSRPSPGRRYGMSMTYDSTHHVVALFGGAVGNFPTIAQAHNDIWNWDGTDWTKVSGN